MASVWREKLSEGDEFGAYELWLQSRPVDVSIFKESGWLCGFTASHSGEWYFKLPANWHVICNG